MAYYDLYRGYRIEYRNRFRRAFIWPPNSGLALETIPQATSEDWEVLRQRVRAVIDTEIDSFQG